MRSGTIPDDLTTIKTEVLRTAATEALIHGVGFVIYDQPLNRSTPH